MRIDRPGYLVHGAVSLEYGDRWIRPWRLPFNRLSLYPSPDDGLVTRAEKTSGVRLQFRTDAASVVLSLTMVLEEETDNASFDVVQDGRLLSAADAKAGQIRIEVPLPGSTDALYEIWFPTFAQIRLEAVDFPDATFVDPGTDTRPRWVTYGSSITHCRTAFSPARSWPATAARIRGLHLTSLGFGGQCHLDGMVAKGIRDLDFDILTLKLGINVYGGSTLNQRTFLPAVINLVDTIRERHPDAPIGLISPIWSPDRETDRNPSGMTLRDYRDMVAKACSLLEQHGDQNVHFFSGLDLLGESDAHLLPDNLHPNGEGYELIGRRVAEYVLPVLLST